MTLTSEEHDAIDFPVSYLYSYGFYDGGGLFSFSSHSI